MEQRPEFFKLNEIDRKVLAWLLKQAPQGVKGWVTFIADEYKRKGVKIDEKRLLEETKES